MTHCKRGDIVLVLFPNSDMITYKKRPALVVQADTVDTGLQQKIIAPLTSNLNRTGPTRVLFRKDSPEGEAMGLQMDSVVVADNLATILYSEIDKVIGVCPSMDKVDSALRTTFGL